MALDLTPRTSLRAGAAALVLALAACTAPTTSEATPEAKTSPATKPADGSVAKGLSGLSKLWGRPPPKPWSFDFKDPPEGPRAPTTAAYGVTIGTTMHPEVDAYVQKLGLTCSDTSVRAMMDRRRVVEKAKVAEAAARGEDAMTAASWVNKRSKRESNPQLRFSCPKVSSDQLTDRPRPPSSGRLLYVFDDAAYPLRHASYQRTHRDHTAALTDFNDAVAALTKLYGPPTKPLTGVLPTPDKDGKVEIPAARNLEISWEYADLLARVNILRYGELVTIGERVEVPHGLRPDAPRFVAGQTPPLPPPATPPVLAGSPVDVPAVPEVPELLEAPDPASPPASL